MLDSCQVGSKLCVAWPRRPTAWLARGEPKEFNVEFNIAQVFAAVAAANPDRDCIVFGDRRFTFAQTDERARRFARALHGWGLGAHRERSELAAHESGQSHLGLYMANCNEFVEAMLGAYGARVAPFNVNYRLSLIHI